MEYINDAELLDALLKREKIREKFGTAELSFRLIRYSKGELLTSTEKPLKNFLFIAEGEIRLYGILDDGRIFSVGQGREHRMLGDVEFAGKKPSMFMTEALSEVLCVALPMKSNEEALRKDIKFLNFIVESLAKTLDLNSRIELSSPSLEAKLLLFLSEISPKPEIDGIEKCVSALHCSRRQLQRVIKKLTEEGRLAKTGKGKYKLLS